MNVVVATPKLYCAACATLKTEGVKFQAFVTKEDDDYGKMLWSLWQEQLPFVLIEWDVAPWPGAITQLHECS